MYSINQSQELRLSLTRLKHCFSALIYIFHWTVNDTCMCTLAWASLPYVCSREEFHSTVPSHHPIAAGDTPVAYEYVAPVTLVGDLCSYTGVES